MQTAQIVFHLFVCFCSLALRSPHHWPITSELLPVAEHHETILHLQDDFLDCLFPEKEEAVCFNTFMTKGAFPSLSFGRAHFHFEQHQELFRIFTPFFYEIPLSKQNCPRWDATFCGITSGATLFAYFQQIGYQAYMS